MKTVKYERKENAPPLLVNPFIAGSIGTVMMSAGRTAIIDTGIKLLMPFQTQFRICDNLREDIVVTHAFLTKEEYLRLVVTPYGDSDMYVIRPGDNLALIEISSSDGAEAVRYVEIKDGKRVSYGDGFQISPDNC